MRPKRTKKRYAELHDNPQALFEGVETIVFPNGENEIWFKDDRGHGFKVVASRGPAGLGLRVSRFVGGAPIHARLFDKDYAMGRFPEAIEAELTQYNPTDHARDFAAWYDADAAGREGKHPEAKDYDEHGSRKVVA